MKKLNLREKEYIDFTESRRIRRMKLSNIMYPMIQFFNLEKGLLLTVRELTLRPGSTIRGYLDTDRFKFTNPFKYYFITVSIYLFLHLRFFDDRSGSDGSSSTFDNPVMQILIDYLNIWIVLFAFIVSLFSYLMFRKATGFNVAENLILNIFITSQILLLTIILMPSYLTDNHIIKTSASILLGGAGTIYILITYKYFFCQSWLKTVLKGVASVVFAIFLILFGAGLAGFILGLSEVFMQR